MANIERGGIASFYLDGAYYQVGADIEVKAGGLVRKPKVASDGVAGFTTEWVAPDVTLTALDGPQVSVTALKAINGQTLQIRMNNGKTWNVLNAFQVDDPSVKIKDGDIGSLKFSGTRCQEILGAA